MKVFRESKVGVGESDDPFFIELNNQDILFSIPDLDRGFLGPHDSSICHRGISFFLKMVSLS